MTYCTLFNTAYLSKALSMIASLEREARHEYRLYALAMDEETLHILTKLNLKNVYPISLKEFETPELLEKKAQRSLVEYCWTCTPAIIDYVFKKYGSRECTYLDADLFFFNDPQILLDEVRGSGKSVLITPHNYTKFFDQTKNSGIFCVQFMYFKNDNHGSKVLSDWLQKCLEWCYARVENGKFGDQKYLDSWPQQFKNEVHVLTHPGCLAPWNVQRYEVSLDAEKLMLKKGHKTFPVVFYHFHGFHLYAHGKRTFGWYPLSSQVRQLIYSPFCREIDLQERRLPQITKKAAPVRGAWDVLRQLRLVFWQCFYFLLRVRT